MATETPRRTPESEVMNFVSSIADTARLRIEEDLPHGFVRLKVAEAERRQAQHDIRCVEDVVTEMLRNSRDAGAGNILVASQKEGGRFRKITVIDDGCGIPPEMHRVVFEPRVTSKREDFEEDRYGVHGRGMALFSISSRADDVGIVASAPGLGTAMSFMIDTRKVTERSDQSSMPGLVDADGALEVGGGPHNVLRVLLEMSVDSRRTDFYVGSCSEILATARALARGSGHGGALWSELADVEDARQLASAASVSLGLHVSDRNAYRIISGEIEPLKTVLELARAVVGDDSGGGRSAVAAKVAARRVRGQQRMIGREDLREIENGARDVVDAVAARYFLKTSGPARVRRGRDKLSISFHLTRQEPEER